MEFIYPTVDITEVKDDGICYAFDHDTLVVFGSDSSITTYQKINDKYFNTYIDNVYNYSNYKCYTYHDISKIPHSSSGLAPIYAFLCVIIFTIMVYVPYKILLKPVMPSI